MCRCLELIVLLSCACFMVLDVTALQCIPPSELHITKEAISRCCIPAAVPTGLYCTLIYTNTHIYTFCSCIMPNFIFETLVKISYF